MNPGKRCWLTEVVKTESGCFEGILGLSDNVRKNEGTKSQGPSHDLMQHLLGYLLLKFHPNPMRVKLLRVTPNTEALLCNFVETTLRHGCSPVNLLYIFRTPFPENISGGLSLQISYLINQKGYICLHYSKKTNSKLLNEFIFRKVDCFSTIKASETSFHILFYILSGIILVTK